MTSSTAPFVVVGTGIAGVSAVESLRSAGYEGELVLIGDEPELPYRRPPVSKEIVRGEREVDRIRIKPAAWYESHAVELRTDLRVEAVDPTDHTLDLGPGGTQPYSKLLLATGGRARSLGAAQDVHTLRTLADVPRLRAGLVPGAHVVVVGAGLIGSEIAASARAMGCEVTLLEVASLPLSRLLPPLLAEHYAALHRAEGTELHTDVAVVSITDEPDGTVVRAADGRSWTGSTVVLAVGMQPATELAEAAGIEVSDGIVVDETGRTSAPDVFAAGDVANLPSALLGARHRVEHWQHAQHHGTAVGRAMAGLEVAFDEVPWCWSDQYGRTLQVTGWPLSSHEVVLRGELGADDFCAFFLDGDRLWGAVSIGRPLDVRTARRWIADEARLDVSRLADASSELEDALVHHPIRREGA